MSFSFFSTQKSIDLTNVTDDAEISKEIRTMQDDFLDIKNKEKITSAQKNQEEKKETLKTLAQETLPKQALNPFSKEANKIYETQINPPERKVIQLKETIIGQKGFVPRKNSEQKGMKNSPVSIFPVPTSLPKNQQSQGKSNLLLVIGIVMITLVLILSGTYYYLFVMKKEVVSTPTSPEQVIEPVVPEEVANPILKEPIYSLDKPNYLSVDTEAVSPEEIQKTFSVVASRIKEASISQSVEFLITDHSNNPVAFSRFATLLGIVLPQELLSHINESFSLYIYNDAGFMRVGLNLTVDDQTIVLSTLSKIEGTLPFLFQTLMLEPGIIVPKTLVFKSNTYASSSLPEQKNPLRYANIDIPKKVSIDYAVVGNHWYTGTSRNTLIVLLDRITK